MLQRQASNWVLWKHSGQARVHGIISQWILLEAGGLRADSSPRWRSAVEPPTSPPASASGVESDSGLVRGRQSTDPPRSRSESAADFKVRLESAWVRLESARIVSIPPGMHFGGAPPDSARSPAAPLESARSPAAPLESARSPAAPPRSPLHDR